MTGSEVANILIQKLLDLGFIIHRYNSYTTNSIYLKIDYGVSCGIRIADHPGKKKYSYRFNIIKDFNGNKAIVKDGLICLFYDFSEINDVISAVVQEKQNKVNKYGLKNYEMYMKKDSQSILYKRFKEIKKGKIKNEWF